MVLMFIYLPYSSITSNEVLDIYRRKDVVEKCFDNLKNAIDMKRLRSHCTESSDGKMFIAFVSLITTLNT
jgi:transposase